MTARRRKLTNEEAMIWRAAYGSAFSAAVFRNLDMLIASRRVTFDVAVGNNAETAGGIADHAVARFRRWREDNDPGFGKKQ